MTRSDPSTVVQGGWTAFTAACAAGSLDNAEWLHNVCGMRPQSQVSACLFGSLRVPCLTSAHSTPQPSSSDFLRACAAGNAQLVIWMIDTLGCDPFETTPVSDVWRIFRCT